MAKITGETTKWNQGCSEDCEEEEDIEEEDGIEEIEEN